SASTQASAMPTSIGRLRAFFASGRFMVTIIVVPSSSTVRFSVPATSRLLRRRPFGIRPSSVVLRRSAPQRCPSESRTHSSFRGYCPLMEFNLADLFENAADAFGEREYLVADDERRTYAEMEARANRLAHHLAAKGVGPDDHVGI